MNIIQTNFHYRADFTMSNRPIYIILHHAEATTCSAEDIHNWHYNKQDPVTGKYWIGAGYHYFVRKDGSIYALRPELAASANCYGHNNDSIAICAEGNYKVDPQMPIAQENAIVELCKYVEGKYAIKGIYGHKEIALADEPTDCPGDHYPLNEIKDLVKNGGTATGSPTAGNYNSLSSTYAAFTSANGPKSGSGSEDEQSLAEERKSNLYDKKGLPAYNFDADTIQHIMELSCRMHNARRSSPPGYYEYIELPHRTGMIDKYSLRIGDCIFQIPPEFIEIKTTSSTKSYTGIRQSNSVKTKSGFSKRTIQVSLFFCGYDQINGFQVKNTPMGYYYYHDGLRSLLAQFKCTPFLPVENEFLNIVNDVWNVALLGINVSTVPGFPQCLTAQLTLLETNVVPLIEAPNFLYNDFIDWDLFRFYYQQWLMDSPPDVITSRTFPLSKTGNGHDMREEFKIKVISEDFLAGLSKQQNDNANSADMQTRNKDIGNWILNSDSNFYDVVNSDMRITMTDIYIGYQNMLSELQLSKHESPTYQYMGGMDTTFTMIFETYDRDVVNRFTRLQKQTMRYVRDYRNLVGLGFVAVDNELVQMFGTKFVMINSIDVSTIPDFPDHFKIILDTVSYDPTQFSSEELTGFKPFVNTSSSGQQNNGTFDDAIDNTREGLVKKVKQDSYVEIFMAQMDLYPDLYLPTVDDVNDAITKIIKFRQDNKLRQIRYSDYPLDPIDEGYPPKFVDPDFYVFYPLQWNNLSDEAKKLVDAGIGGSSGSQFGGVGGPYATEKDFIQALVPGAIQGWHDYGILPSVTIAQALGEAGWQMSQPCAYKDNNLFGIKFAGNHAPNLHITGGTLPTDGDRQGQYCHYDSISDSIIDHGYFLANNSRYKAAIGLTSAEAQINAIAAAGYAENKHYARDLMQLVNDNNLTQYDNGSGAYTNTSGGVGTGKTTVNLDKELFGTPIIGMSLLEEGSGNPFLETNHYVERACTDMRCYNARGRMLRAFPTYCMLILDEGGDWLDGRKLWTNYYRQHNLVDISIHQTKENPVHTAVIKVTNVYQNLSRYPSIKTFDDSKQSSSWWYKTFGIMVGSPYLTQEMIDNKNVLVSHVNLDTGARIHVRLGYGANASALPINFNGLVTEIDTGDIINIVAQSDGLELSNNVISTVANKTNNILNFGTEPSNIIFNILDNRQSWMAPFLALFNKTKDKSRGTYFEANQFGIEHFGQYMFNLSDVQSAQDGVEGGDLIKNLFYNPDSSNALSIPYFLGTVINNIKDMGIWAWIKDLTGVEKATLDKDKIKEDWTKNVLLYSRQYDLIKNIYVANYRGETMAMKEESELKMLDPFDGENNIRMFIYNKTPWDVFQVVAQFTPEYICQPHYNQFHSTVFFGHPSWNVKYKYKLIGNKLYEYAKPYSQYHIYDTMSDIIDNQIIASSKDLFTNVVASYTIHNSLETTPVLYADRNIYWHLQKTKVIDTTVYQNLPFLNTLAKVAGWKPGEEAAIQIGISNLMDSFAKMYKGSLIVIGDPSVKPCDTMGIMDDYVDMHGTAGVREVIHHMSLETGFITEIVPELVTGQATENSLTIDWLPTFGSLTLGFASIKALKYVGLQAITSIDRSITAKTGVRALNTTANLFFKVKDVLTSGNAVVKFKETATTLEGAAKAWNAVKGAVEISSTLIEAEEGAALLGTMICPGIGTIVLGLAASVMLNTLFDAIVEYFHYWNCVKIFPLVYKGRNFTMGVTGHKRLIYGITDSENDLDMTARNAGIGSKYVTDKASVSVTGGSSGSLALAAAPGGGGNNGGGFPLENHNAPITGAYKENRGDHLHDGVDFGVPVGTPVFAVTNGEIINDTIITGYGNSILLWDGSHTWHYAHLSSFQAHVGDKVTKGQQIGLTGGADSLRPPGVEKGSPDDPVGWSTGPHLHFGCYSTHGWSTSNIDPLAALKNL